MARPKANQETSANESLDDFIRRHEDAANDKGVVVVRVSVPGAESRVFPGRYSGIVVADGDHEAIYSDGTKHK